MGETNAREALQENGNGELDLEQRKRRAQAEVRATPERAVVHTLARDVETVRSGILLGIAIGEQSRGAARGSDCRGTLLSQR
jgi:hypothetical protein